MKLLALISVLASAIVSVLGQTIEIGAPAAGTVLYPGQNFTAQIILPVSPRNEASHSYLLNLIRQISMADVVQVGIALALNDCPNGVCNAQPDCPLYYPLYVGPWTPNTSGRGGYYQNFTLKVPDGMPAGPAVFTLVHFGLMGVTSFCLHCCRQSVLNQMVAIS